MADLVVAHILADLGNRQVGAGDEILGHIQTVLVEIFHWSHVGIFFEHISSVDAYHNVGSLLLKLSSW